MYKNVGVRFAEPKQTVVIYLEFIKQASNKFLNAVSSIMLTLVKATNYFEIELGSLAAVKQHLLK